MNNELLTMLGVEPSEQLRERICRQQPRTLLSFSCGKDSIAMWLALQGSIEIVPFYCYRFPQLEIVEESLAYFEKFFQQRIIRLPHPALYRWINRLIFAAPDDKEIKKACRLPVFTFDDLHRILLEDLKLPDDTFMALGVRASDSFNRNRHFANFGAVNETTKVWHPIWDWKVSKLWNEIRRSGIKLPVDYQLFGRSFDGLNYQFLAPLKKHFPRDYQRIIELFPIAEAELKRKEFYDQKK